MSTTIEVPAKTITTILDILCANAEVTTRSTGYKGTTMKATFESNVATGGVATAMGELMKKIKPFMDHYPVIFPNDYQMAKPDRPSSVVGISMPDYGMIYPLTPPPPSMHPAWGKGSPQNPLTVPQQRRLQKELPSLHTVAPDLYVEKMIQLIERKGWECAILFGGGTGKRRRFTVKVKRPNYVAICNDGETLPAAMVGALIGNLDDDQRPNASRSLYETER